MRSQPAIAPDLPALRSGRRDLRGETAEVSKSSVIALRSFVHYYIRQAVRRHAKWQMGRPRFKSSWHGSREEEMTRLDRKHPCLQESQGDFTASRVTDVYGKAQHLRIASRSWQAGMFALQSLFVAVLITASCGGPDLANKAKPSSTPANRSRHGCSAQAEVRSTRSRNR